MNVYALGMWFMSYELSDFVCMRW